MNNQNLYSSELASPKSKKYWLLGFIVLLVLGIFLYGYVNRSAEQSAEVDYFTGDFSISPDDKYAVFTRFENDSSSLYKASIDGSTICRLTRAEKKQFHQKATYSADGTKIIFVESKKQGVFRSLLFPPLSTLNIIDIPSGKTQKIYTALANFIDPIISIDMNKVYFKQSTRWHWDFGPLDYKIYSLDLADTEKVIREEKAAYPENEDIYYNISNSEREAHKSTTNAAELINISSLIKSGLVDIPGHLPASEQQKRITQRVRYITPSKNNQLIFFIVPSSASKSFFIYEIFSINVESNEVTQLTSLGKSVSNLRRLHNEDSLLFTLDTNRPSKPPAWQLRIISATGSNQKVIGISVDDTVISC